MVSLPKKIRPQFTRPQCILGLYDFLRSDESNQGNIKNYTGSSKLYNGSGWVFLFNCPK